MTVDPRQYERQVLGTAPRTQARSPIIHKKLVRLGWGLGITAITIALMRLSGFGSMNFLDLLTFHHAADFAAFALGLLYITIAIGEGASIFEGVSMGAVAYSFLQPQDWQFVLGAGVVNAVFYLWQQPTSRAAAIFACCFVFANLLRRWGL